MISLKKGFAISAISTLWLTTPSAQAQGLDTIDKTFGASKECVVNTSCSLGKVRSDAEPTLNFQGPDESEAYSNISPYSDRQNYIKVGGGFSQSNHISYTDSTHKVKPALGNFLEVGLGRKINENIRLEINYEKTKSDSYQYNNEKYNEDITTESVLGSLNYDFKNSSQFTPFIGVSLGNANFHSQHTGRTQSVFTYGAQGGLRYELTDAISIETGYKHRILNEPSLTLHTSKPQISKYYVGIAMSF